VLGLILIVNWQLDQAAGHDEVMALARILLRQGAELVAVWPSWVDFSLSMILVCRFASVGFRCVRKSSFIGSPMAR
jgi:hypothetical protein